MNTKTLLQNTKAQLLFLTIIALTLRLYRFRTGETFTSSDETYLFEYSIKPVIAALNPQSIYWTGQELFRYFNFNWGWGFIFFSTINTFILTILKINLTEFTINLPYVLIGTATVVLVYYFGKMISNTASGFIAALITAILPFHISSSRSIGLHGVTTAFFFLLTLFLFLKYFKTQNKKFRTIAHLSLAFYFAVDFQFYVILPIILCAGIIYSKKNWRQVLKDLIYTKSVLFFPIINFPIFVSAGYLASQSLLKNAYISHPFTKQSYFGFFLTDVLKALHFNMNTGLFLLTLLTLSYAIIVILNNYKKKYETCEVQNYYFIVSWLATTTAPFIFFINPKYTTINIYLFNTMFALIFLSGLVTASIILNTIAQKKSLQTTSIMILTALTLTTIIFDAGLTTTLSVFGVDDYKSRQQYNFGALGENTGAKTAGYYFRTQVPLNETIFTDDETFVGNYYMNRPVLGDLDLEGKQIFNKYLEIKTNTQIDWISVQTKNKQFFEDELKIDNYTLCINITYKNKTVRQIFKKKPCVFSIMGVEKTDLRFDKEYGTIFKLFYDYE